MNKELWEKHDQLLEVTPHRSVYWGIYRTQAEAVEFTQTDPELTPQEFLDEGSDIIISVMTTFKSAGISYEVALQAIHNKLDEITDRATKATIEVPIFDSEWEEAYQRIKQKAKSP